MYDKEKKKVRDQKWRQENKERIREYDRAYRSLHREKLNGRFRKRSLDSKYKERRAAYCRLKTYGLTEEKFEELFTSQGESCGIFRSKIPSTKKGWVVDHCHLTGIVRGILCSHCNSMLGYAREDAAALESAISYLNRYKATK